MRICYAPRGSAEAHRECLRRAKDGPQALATCIMLTLGSYLN